MWYNMCNRCGGYFPHNKQTNKQTNKRKKRETNMKIKNLAFFGVMAAIMGVAGTARADTTTVIASQAYVDAKDELDEKTANKETATYAASTNKTSTTMYPSMATLKDAYDTLNTAISNVDVSDAVHDGIRDGRASG